MSAKDQQFEEAKQKMDAIKKEYKRLKMNAYQRQYYARTKQQKQTLIKDISEFSHQIFSLDNAQDKTSKDAECQTDDIVILQNSTCCICFETKQLIGFGCHIEHSSCMKCFAKIQKTTGQCPICRKDISYGLFKKEKKTMSFHQLSDHLGKITEQLGLSGMFISTVENDDFINICTDIKPRINQELYAYVQVELD